MWGVVVIYRGGFYVRSDCDWVALQTGQSDSYGMCDMDDIWSEFAKLVSEIRRAVRYAEKRRLCFDWGICADFRYSKVLRDGDVMGNLKFYSTRRLVTTVLHHIDGIEEISQ